jgi:hypothetical protein
LLNYILKIFVNIKNYFSKGDSNKSRRIAKRIVDENDIVNLNGVINYMRKNFDYGSDPLNGIIDTQYDLDKIIETGGVDDCDGFAIISKRLCSAIGLQSKILTYVPLNITKSHVISVIEINDVFDAEKLGKEKIIKNKKPYYMVLSVKNIYGSFDSIEEIISFFEEKIDSKIIAYDLRDGIN